MKKKRRINIDLSSRSKYQEKLLEKYLCDKEIVYRKGMYLNKKIIIVENKKGIKKIIPYLKANKINAFYTYRETPSKISFFINNN